MHKKLVQLSKMLYHVEYSVQSNDDSTKIVHPKQSNSRFSSILYPSPTAHGRPFLSILPSRSGVNAPPIVKTFNVFEDDAQAC